jgi:hypothetical protein
MKERFVPSQSWYEHRNMFRDGSADQIAKRRYPQVKHPSSPAPLISDATAIKKHLGHLRTILVPKSRWVGSEKQLVQMLRDCDDAF